MNNDDTEKLFSGLRQANGGNYNIGAVAAMSGMEKISQTGLVYSSINSNVRLEKETHTLRLINQGERRYKARCNEALDQMPEENVSILAELRRATGK